MEGIAGKVAVVTGGSSGIGLATARALCLAGARVAIAARSPERGEAAARVLRDEGGEAHFVETDVSRALDVGSSSSRRWSTSGAGSTSR